MRARSLLAVLAVIALVAAPAASAAKAKPKPKPKPKVYCNLLTDKTADGKSDVFPGVQSGGLDIIGGDLATGPKTMVAVLRLADTNFSTSHDPWAVGLGYSWTFGVTSNLGQSYQFTANLRQLSGAIEASASVTNVGVTLKSFKIDTTHNTLTWVIDRSVDKTLTRKGTIFKEFRGHSMAFGDSADDAPDQPIPGITYPDKALSCVHAS